MKVRSLFISDTHLGSDHCKSEELLHLLSNVECEYLYIVGDFIDGWSLQNNFKWKATYNTILQKILRMSRKGTHVVYIWGNHDDFMRSFTDSQFGDMVSVKREVTHLTITNKKILIIHGDQFDGIITENKFIQKIGSVIYDWSLYLNVVFRYFKFSLSKFLKEKAKSAVNYISGYETAMIEHCKSHGYDIVVCGHIHRPEILLKDNVLYVNTGDWVENNTFVVEKFDGTLELIAYNEIKHTL